MISFNEKSNEDVIMEKILEDKLEEMGRTIETVRVLKEGINANGTGSVSCCFNFSLGGCDSPSCQQSHEVTLPCFSVK